MHADTEDPPLAAFWRLDRSSTSSFSSSLDHQPEPHQGASWSHLQLSTGAMKTSCFIPFVELLPCHVLAQTLCMHTRTSIPVQFAHQ